MNKPIRNSRRRPKPPTEPNPAVPLPEGERLQKVLAHAGLGSRRQIEGWIRDGKIQVNGRQAQLGDRWRSEDVVKIHGRIVRLNKRLGAAIRVLAYHKPVGEVVSRRDPEGRPTIFKHLPKLEKGRWIAVGRLDINTEGLLLLTNHGELANQLMHPSSELEREYAVRIFGAVTDDMLKKLRQGVMLEDGMARFEAIESAGGEGANRWYKVVLKEGRNRIVRRLWESQGVTVSRLIRVRYGPVALPDGLRKGRVYELAAGEIEQLRAFVREQTLGAPAG